MKLILHCGEGKTGSSSIQRMLKASSKQLIESGILYHSETRSGHFDFHYLVGKRHRVPKEKDKFILNRAKKAITTIKILAHQYQPDFVILSSEAFFAYSKHELQQIVDSLELEFTDRFSIVYVRPPVDYYLSVVQQQIKCSHSIHDPLTHKRDVSKYLTILKEFVGDSNLFGSVFTREALYQKDVTKDFLRKLERITNRNLVLNEFFKFSNESITAEQMILLQEFRRDFFRDFNDQMMPSSRNLVKLFQGINSIKILGSKPKLREELKGAIFNNNKDYIERANKLLSADTEFDLFVSSADAYQAKGSAGKKISNVSDILSSWDPKFYSIFKNIIVEYNKNLKPGLLDFLSCFDSEARKEVSRVYFKYIISSDYPGAMKIKKLKKSKTNNFEREFINLL